MLIAQLLAFTPIAFLVLIGVVQGISPSLEEAAQTLRASRWTTFRTVTLPLMRPGLANAFLLGFVESIADFGNPLVLGGNFEVLSTEDLLRRRRRAARPGTRRRAVASCCSPSRSAPSGCSSAWLGQEGLHDRDRQGRCRPAAAAAASASRCACYAIALPWALFTFVIYAIILVGGFVKIDGPRLHADARPLPHRVPHRERPDRGVIFAGSAWNSFFATMKLAAIAAPLTAAIGLLTA